MPPVAAAAAAWAASAAAAATYAVVAEYAAFTLLAGAVGSSVIAGVAAAAAYAAVSYVGAEVVSSMAPTPSAAERLEMIRMPAGTRRIVYGACRVSGHLIYCGQSDDKNHIDLLVALSHGPITSIAPAYRIADKASTDPVFAGLLSRVDRLGDADQTAIFELITNQPGDWSAAHRLAGAACVYLRWRYDRNAFPHGLVSASFDVRGRAVYDPRTSTTGYSANAALVSLDYLRASWGLSVPDHRIDFSSFAAAANVCDEIVQTLDQGQIIDGTPGRVRRYSINGPIDLGAAPGAVLAQFESAMSGRIIFAQGKYRCYAGAWRAPTATLTERWLRGPLTCRLEPSRIDTANTVTGTYVEPQHDWQSIDYQPQVDSSLATRYGENVQDGADYPLITHGGTAQRLARIRLRRTTGERTINLPCNWAALSLRAGSSVALELPQIGLDGDSYEVTGWALADDMQGVDLTLSPHRPEDYAWTLAEETAVQPKATPVTPGTVPPPVQGLTASGEPGPSGQRQISASWEHTAFATLDGYQVDVRELSASSQPSATALTTVRVQDNRYSLTLPSTSTAPQYRVVVRGVTQGGSLAPPASIDVAPLTNAGVPPGPPVNASAQPSGDTVRLTWTTPSDADFDRTLIYAGAADTGPGAATLIVTRRDFPGQTWTQVEPLTAGADAWWAQSVDVAGNASARTLMTTTDPNP